MEEWSIRLLTAVIAVFVAYIAYHQMRTNKLRLKFELYDRRLKVYRDAKKLIRDAPDVKADYDTVMLIFDALTESDFLFERDIPDYLGELWDKTNKLVYLRGKVTEGYGGMDEQITELVQYFHSQDDICREKFRKYLSIPQVL